MKHGLTNGQQGGNLGFVAVVPNPLMGSAGQNATVSFTLTNATTVMVAVFDQVGNQVQVLMDQSVDAGAHSVTLRGSSLRAGLYIVEVNAGGELQTSRLIVQ